MNSDVRYGADSSEWDNILSNAELKPWVLPIVSNVNLKISPRSDIKEIGKTPTIKNSDGFIAGIRGWTTRPEATDEELIKWSQDSDNGYCIRTGHDGIIGIDCDVNDPTLSKQVKDLFIRSCGIKEEDFTCRVRGNARWAVLVKLDTGASFSKSVIDLDGPEVDGKKPIVEFLGLGQQLACAGTHPSGVKYSWSNGLKALHISEKDYKAFKDALVMLFGAFDEKSTKSSGPRVKGETFKADDRLADWLTTSGRVIKSGAQGELYITCPWCSNHTNKTGDQETAYFPVGSNGYTQGGFKCLHAHCADKSLNDFREWAKAQGFTETEAENYPDERATVAENATVEEKPSTAAKLMRWKNEKTGLIDPCATSIFTAISDADFIGYDITYDTFTGSNLIRPKKTKDWDVYCEAHNMELRLRLESLDFRPGKVGKDLINDAVNLTATRNQRDTMKEYLRDNLPQWDGVPRVEKFFSTYCGAEDTEYTRAVGRYMWGLLYRRASDPEPIKADISVILIGAQGANKSQFIKALALENRFYIDLDFKREATELALRMKGHVVIEIPEMNGLNKRQNSELKAFLSTDSDTYRVIYTQDQRTVTRRSIILMTVNEHQILTDPTGNRRYAPVEVSTFDYEKVLPDVKQLWAEGKVIFEKLGGKKLHQDVEIITKERNKDYYLSDGWEDMIATWLRSQEQLPKEERLMPTYTNILKYALQFNPSQMTKEANIRLRDVMTHMGYVFKAVKLNGESRRAWAPKK